MGFFKSLFKGPSEPEDEPEITAPEPPPPPPRAPSDADEPGPSVDFVAVLEAAGVDADQRSRVVKAQELLRTLPADAPAAVKRGIVEAAFRAFDIPTQKIVTAASNEIDALKAFIRASEERMQQILADGAKQIADLERKITEVKQAMARSVAEQESNIDATQAELLEVEPVLRFFQPDTTAAAAPKPAKADEAAAAPRAAQRPQEDSSVEIQWEPGPDGS
jgi:hypothetical protein